jgi:Asp-tRNA(Asn)/Glu-tRNA(Gln) amidotransferase A subunit family amidase
VKSIPAFRHGEHSWTIEGKTVNYLDAWSYTSGLICLGIRGAVVPVSQSAEGLPIGVQIVGRPWQEEQVLVVAAALEKEYNAWKIPPIH